MYVISIFIQEITGVEKESYDAQKAAYNRTIQHTVAGVLPDIPPERVTDIVVEEEEEEGGRAKAEHLRGKHGLLSSETTAVPHLILKYKITVFDPVLTLEKVRAELNQAVQDGTMDRDLRAFAANFGAMNLNNCTFAEPQVASAGAERGDSEQLTGVMIALLVVGVVVCLALLAAGGYFFRQQSV